MLCLILIQSKCLKQEFILVISMSIEEEKIRKYAIAYRKVYGTEVDLRTAEKQAVQLLNMLRAIIKNCDRD